MQAWNLGMAAMAAVVTALAAGVACADGVRTDVKFPKGSTGTTIEGSVLRGDRDRYVLGARRGQVLDVSIASPEKNAVFAVYLPGANDKDPTDIKGSPLGKGEELRTLKAVLPADGRYLIVVGGTRGNADYKLTVNIANAPASR